MVVSSFPCFLSYRTRINAPARPSAPGKGEAGRFPRYYIVSPRRIQWVRRPCAEEPDRLSEPLHHTGIPAGGSNTSYGKIYVKNRWSLCFLNEESFDFYADPVLSGRIA